MTDDPILAELQALRTEVRALGLQVAELLATARRPPVRPYPSDQTGIAPCPYCIAARQRGGRGCNRHPGRPQY